MRHNNKGKKTRAASDKAIFASVTKEMAQPRMAQSVKIKTDKQVTPRDGERVLCEIPPKAS
jgi:hypothetical protein